MWRPWQTEKGRRGIGSRKKNRRAEKQKSRKTGKVHTPGNYRHRQRHPGNKSRRYIPKILQRRKHRRYAGPWLGPVPDPGNHNPSGRLCKSNVRPQPGIHIFHLPSQPLTSFCVSNSPYLGNLFGFCDFYATFPFYNLYIENDAGKQCGREQL